MAGRPRGAPALLLSTSKAAPAALPLVLGSQVLLEPSTGPPSRAWSYMGYMGRGCRNRGCSAWRGGGTWGAPRSTEQSSGVPGTRGGGPGHKLDPRRLFSGGGGNNLPQGRRLGVFAGLQEHPATKASTHRPLL